MCRYKLEGSIVEIDQLIGDGLLGATTSAVRLKELWGRVQRCEDVGSEVEEEGAANGANTRDNYS